MDNVRRLCFYCVLFGMLCAQLLAMDGWKRDAIVSQ